jgi:hypothetical protein
MPYKDPKKTQEWTKENRRFFGVNLMINTDADIISWLEKQSSMQGAIKDALRSYIALQEESNASET